MTRPNRPPPLPRRPLARRPALAPAIVGALVVALVMPSVVAARGVVVRAVDPSVTFYGRGYGHGVGLSQYGARGRALAGQTAAQILAHYYQGTTLGAVNPGLAVRVLVLSSFSATGAAPATFHSSGGTWTVDGVAKTFPAGARITLAPTTPGGSTWLLRVTSGSTTLHNANVSGSVTFRPTVAATRLQVDSRTSSYDTYRGLLRVHLSTKVSVVNELGVDAYLLGVVPAEVPSSWPAEALRAQSIAARSYAVYHLHPTTGTFDVYDDTRSQVYRGAEGELAPTNAAIAATSGQVVKKGSAVANTLFHSTAGGATENNEFAFVSSSGAIVAGPVSYLRGVPDRAPDNTPYDAAAPYAAWQTATYRLSELSPMFAADPRTAVGKLSKIDLSAVGVSGRLIRVVLSGSSGSKTVSGDVFRAVFNDHRPAGDPVLRSTLFATAPIP